MIGCSSIAGNIIFRKRKGKLKTEAFFCDGPQLSVKSSLSFRLHRTIIFTYDT